MGAASRSAFATSTAAAASALLSPCRCSWLLLLLLLLGAWHTLLATAAAASVASWRGIAPEDRAYFTGKTTIACRDGSKTIPIERVNDDFCDCPDGTDEPGTSACPSGLFFCRNRGHDPQRLFSSRVNDGICDCCDGSDEFDGRGRCSNSCIEKGAAAREALKRKVALVKEGWKQREGFVREAAESRRKWEEEKARLEEERKELEVKEADLKAKKLEIEKAEREAREWQERLRREQEERERLEKETRKPVTGAEKDESGADAAAAGVGGAEEQVPGGSSGVDDSVPEEDYEGVTMGRGGRGEEGEDGEDEEKRRRMEDAERFREQTAEMIKAEEEKHFARAGSASDVEAAPAAADASAPAAAAAAAADGGSPSPAEAEGEEDLGDLSPEELGRRIASRWTHEQEEHGHGGEHGGDDEHGSVPVYGEQHEEFEEPEEEREERVHAEDTPLDIEDDDLDYHGHDAHQDERHVADDDEEDEEDDFEMKVPPAVSPRSTWWARMLQWPRDICSRLYSLSWPTPAPPPVDQSEAELVKAEFKRVESEVGKMRTRIRLLQDKLANDLGPEGEFLSFVDKCFTFHVTHYVYEICPFKRVTQKEGHSHTTVGNWKGFADDYNSMLFKDGDHCWNGPSRSMKVSLECGVADEVVSVEEPSRCEYAAVLRTPSKCTSEIAKALEDELREKELEITQPHDEL